MHALVHQLATEVFIQSFLVEAEWQVCQIFFAATVMAKREQKM